MDNLFATLPFPWHLPAADELLRSLKRIYFKDNTLQEFLASLGDKVVDFTLIDWGTSIHFVWRDVIEQNAVKGSLRLLVEECVARNAASPVAPTLKKLLEGNPGALPEPTTDKGMAAFTIGDQESSTQEKLLYGDDLTVDVAVVRMILNVASAVCRLTVSTATSTGYGSGFLIGKDLVLTNNHVLQPRGVGAQSVLVEFNYELRPDGLPTAAEAIAGKVQTITTEKADDWGIIQLQTAPQGDYRVLPLPSATAAAIGDAAFIVQHPGGLPKRIGLVRNRIELVHPSVVHYLTDTQPGSSGSPVFGRTGELIALHHAGGTLPLPTEPGVKVWKNEGINIVRVRERLLASGVLFDAMGARLP